MTLLVVGAAAAFSLDLVDRVRETFAPAVSFEPDLEGDPLIAGRAPGKGVSDFVLTVVPTQKRVTFAAMCRSAVPDTQISFWRVTEGRMEPLLLGDCRPDRDRPAISWGGYDGLPVGVPSTLHVSFTGLGLTPVRDPDVRLALAVYDEKGPRHRAGGLAFRDHLRVGGADHRLAGSAQNPVPDDSGDSSQVSIRVPAGTAPAVVVVHCTGDTALMGAGTGLDLSVDNRPEGRGNWGCSWGPTVLPDARAHTVTAFVSGPGTGRVAIAYYVRVR